jgi:hypothetical protein
MNFNATFAASGADFLDMRLRRLPAGLFKAFYFVRCVAACNGGRLPAVEEIAFLLGSRTAVVERRLAALRELGLLEERHGELRLAARFDEEAEDRDEGEEELGRPMTAAERTRRWRERKAGRDGAVTGGASHGDVSAVTQERDIESLPSEDISPAVTPSPSQPAGGVYSRFDEFWSAFPVGAHSKQPALAAWRKAVVAGADPEAIIQAARAYAEATAGREARFIAAPQNWLAQERWRADPPPAAEAVPAGEWIKHGSDEWEAWSAHWRATKGRSPPLDKRGGWRFPSRWPREFEAMAVAAE